MKIYAVIFAVVTTLLVGALPSSAGDTASIQKAWRAQGNRVLIMAHRGNHRKAPENTIISFEKAIEAGADFVEADVRLTLDNHWIVYHDRVMMTRSGHRRVVSSMTLAEINYHRLSGKSYALPDQSIPSLDEVLDALKGKVLIYLDDKMGRPLELADMIREHEMEDQVIVGINDFADAILMSEFASDIAWLGHVKPIKNDIDKYLALKPKIIQVHDVFALTDDDIARIHKAGALIMVNASGPRDEDKYYSIAIEKVGADIIETDNLDKIIAFIDAQETKST